MAESLAHDWIFLSRIAVLFLGFPPLTGAAPNRGQGLGQNLHDIGRQQMRVFARVGFNPSQDLQVRPADLFT
jgi:hypothetical protein